MTSWGSRTSPSRRRSLRTVETPSATRRQILSAFGVVPVAHLLGCASADGIALDDLSGAADANADNASNETNNDEASSTGGWATGGTKSMTGNYADPFAAGLGSLCTLLCAATLGPCYAATLVRKDVSEGASGLPMRLAFKVVDEQCEPIEGLTVDIWHTSADGLYSGADASTFCTFGDERATAGRWFRGVQTTDANGRVDFDSCFPGWYSGRTVHIHFTIRRGDVELVTSQLFFDDALTDELTSSQPIYSDRGDRDTTNDNDGVISADEVGDYMLQAARQADGALLAWKTLVVPTSADTALCSVQGGENGGGPGGAPPGGTPPGR
jgi:protocatechuate 3,4-dioxygenase beta subunit